MMDNKLLLQGSNGIEIYEKCRTKMARQAGLEPATLRFEA